MKRFYFVVIISVIFGLLALSVDAAQSYRVNAGQSNVQINEHGVCKKVTNTGAKDVFIPTNTSAEWSGFLAHLPSSVTVGSCVIGHTKYFDTGWNHTCALLSNGNVDCWGLNNYGQANDYTGGNAKLP